MTKNHSSILSIGSSKLTILTGSGGINKNYIIYGKSDICYSGFSNGEFFESNTLAEKIGKAIENVELATKYSIKELTVGVPSEFCYSVTQKINQTFPSKKRLTKEVLSEFYSNNTQELEGYIPISTEPIYNILDNGKKLINAVNQKTVKLTSFLNVVYADEKFIKILNEALSSLGILKVNYIPEILAETQYLFEEPATETCLIDIGYLTTSVAVAKGKGLSNLFSFSLGGAYIMSDLAECLNLSMNEAEELKQKIILTLEPITTEFYETSYLGKNRKIVVKYANEIVKDRLDIIAYTINACLSKCEDIERMPVYLTGGGVSLIKGAKEYLSARINKDIRIISPNLAQFNKPNYCSEVSLLANALKQNEKHRFLVAKFF